MTTLAAPVVVAAEPIGVQAPRQPGKFLLRQKNKTFLPRVLGNRVGSVRRVSERRLHFHNVFSLSGPQPFDLGLYRSGSSRRACVRSPRNLSSLLQHPPADVGAHHGRADTSYWSLRIAAGASCSNCPPGVSRHRAVRTIGACLCRCDRRNGCNRGPRRERSTVTVARRPAPQRVQQGLTWRRLPAGWRPELKRRSAATSGRPAARARQR